MFSSLLLLTIPDTIVYPVIALPLVLAIITWTIILMRRKSGKVAGVIFNGHQWMKWILFLYIGIMLVNYFGSFVPGHWIPVLWHKDGHNEGFIAIMVYTAYTFVCYFFVSFRLANEKEVKEAKDAKQLAVSFLSDAAGAAAGTVGAAGAAAGGILAMIGSLLYPIVMVGGQAFVFLGVGAASFFVGLALMIPIVVILAMIGGFVILIVSFLTGLVVTVGTLLQFLANLRYLR